MPRLLYGLQYGILRLHRQFLRLVNHIDLIRAAVGLYGHIIHQLIADFLHADRRWFFMGDPDNIRVWFPVSAFLQEEQIPQGSVPPLSH